MRRALVILFLAGCQPQAVYVVVDDDDMGTSSTGEVVASTTTGPASATGAPGGSSGAPEPGSSEASTEPLGSTGEVGSTAGSTTNPVGSSTTGPDCPTGSEGCACSGFDLCSGDLQCWQDECVASCTDDPGNDDMHCGGVCGNECPSALVNGEVVGDGCSDGACAPGASECFPLVEGEPVSCAEICGAAGLSCGHDCGGSWEAVRFYSTDCSGEPLGISTGAECATPEFFDGPGGLMESAQCCCQ